MQKEQLKATARCANTAPRLPKTSQEHLKATKSVILERSGEDFCDNRLCVRGVYLLSKIAIGFQRHAILEAVRKSVPLHIVVFASACTIPLALRDLSSAHLMPLAYVSLA